MAKPQAPQVAKKRSQPAPKPATKKRASPSKKATPTKAPPTTSKAKKPARKKRPAAAKKRPESPNRDSDIIIVDDDIHYDPEREAEERRAFLEEARSQDAFD